MKFIKPIIVIVIFLLSTKLFSGLSKIHGKDLPDSYFSNGYPTILGLLDSEIFMGLIFMITLSIVGYILYLLWQLHEVALHKAESDASPQLQLIFALSLSGLFIDKVWWVLAIIIAFTSWEHIGDSFSKIIRKGMGDEGSNK